VPSFPTIKVPLTGKIRQSICAERDAPSKALLAVHFPLPITSDPAGCSR
jgi:hypothetical protein